jgi:subfamily B ATP-binding cassette protein MsbA
MLAELRAAADSSRVTTDPGPPPSVSAPRGASLRTLLARIWRAVLAHRGLVIAILLTSVLEAFFTKAPIVLIQPLLDTFSAASADAPPGGGVPRDGTGAESLEREFKHRFMRWFVDGANDLRDALGIEFEERAQEKSVILACAVIAVLSGLLGGFFIYLATLLSRYFATKIVVDLRDEIAEHLLLLPLRFFGRRRMGELISSLTNNTTVLSRAFNLVSDNIVGDPMMILGNIAILAFWAPEVLPFFIPIVPLMALPMIRLGKKVHRRSGQSMEAMGDSTESMNQMLSGIKTVKAFQLERQRMAEFRESNERFLRRTKRMLQAKGRSQGLVFAGYQIAFAALIVVLGWLLLSGRRTIGDIGMIIVPITTTYTHVKRLTRAYNTMMESVGAMDAIEAILQEVPDEGVRRGGRPVEIVHGDVAMEHISFSYGDEPVLRDVSFAVERGTSVALVGQSGAGKSTLIDLLARFHDPSAGRVLIDGQDLRDLDVGGYRRHIAMVVQQPFLFNTTIGENIRYGRRDASQDEIEAAARAAQIHDFIVTLPKGYDTLVGERGSNLSGGQMQRVTIARAIVRDPAILFLDEATSALDSESEEAVQRALGNLMRGRTSFVIAHRLSTIRDADVILVLSEGRLVERGRHAELLASGGIYRRMLELQQMA